MPFLILFSSKGDCLHNSTKQHCEHRGLSPKSTQMLAFLELRHLRTSHVEERPTTASFTRPLGLPGPNTKTCWFVERGRKAINGSQSLQLMLLTLDADNLHTVTQACNLVLLQPAGAPVRRLAREACQSLERINFCNPWQMPRVVVTHRERTSSDVTGDVTPWRPL